MCFSMVIHYDKYYRGVGESSRPRQSHKLEIAGANPASATNQYLSMVKWYHSAFGTQERRFDSCYRDQFFTRKKANESKSHFGKNTQRSSVTEK